MDNKTAQGGVKTRSIGASIGLIAIVVEYIATAIGVVGTIWGWVRRFGKPEPKQRVLYHYTIGSNEYPADDEAIEYFVGLLEGSKPIVCHHAVNCHPIPLHMYPNLLVMVGSNEYPADDKGINDIKKMMERAMSDESINAIVTHHCVQIHPLMQEDFKAVWENETIPEVVTEDPNHAPEESPEES